MSLKYQVWQNAKWELLIKMGIEIQDENSEAWREFPFKLGIPMQFGKWESKWELKSKMGIAIQDENSEAWREFPFKLGISMQFGKWESK